MVNHDIITAIKTQLGDCILKFEKKSEQRFYVDITAGTLTQVSEVMLDSFGARLQIATGVDTRDGIEVMYHWALDDEACIVTFRTLLDHAEPKLESIAMMCPAAEWIEREMWELLGIQFNNHPDMRHLLLADDWPQGNFPMRRNHEATS